MGGMAVCVGQYKATLCETAKTISRFWVESCVKDLGTSPSLTGREIVIIRIKELKNKYD